jgi:hypothetical protein
MVNVVCELCCALCVGMVCLTISDIFSAKK